MKLRFGLIISIVGTILWTGAMYALNQYTAGVPRSQAVAGVQTEKPVLTYVPNKTSPLTTRINSYRAEKQAAEVVQDARLDALAQERLEEMQRYRYYAHETITGGSFADSFASYGIAADTYSCENLLLTNENTTGSHVAEWDASPAHAACMSNDYMTRVGVAEGIFDETTGQILIVTIYAQGI